MQPFILYDSFQTHCNSFDFLCHYCGNLNSFLSPLCQNIYWKSCQLLLIFLIFMKAQQYKKGIWYTGHIIAEMQL